MQLKWLDDFITLIDTGSFTETASRRHISQPALSRRIQALEDWLGVTLVDRSHKPLKLAPIVVRNEAEFRDIVAHIHQFRVLMEQDALNDGAELTIATQHSLATEFMAGFLEQLAQVDSDQRFQIRTANRVECVDMLIRGRADMLVIHETPHVPTGLPPQLASGISMATDELVLVGSPDLYRAQRDRGPNDLLQLLVYPPDSFFGKVLQGEAMPALLKQRRVVMTCISAFSFGLKELALIGQGAAWLPHSMVRRELQEDRQRQLDFLADPVPLTIGVYFARYSTEAVRKLADRLNCHLGT